MKTPILLILSIFILSPLYAVTPIKDGKLQSALDANGQAINTTGAISFIDSTAKSTTRGNLGVAIGSNVQAWDGDLDSIAALVTTSFGRGLLTESSASTARTTLGATTAGGNLFTVTNPSAVSWLRINADNTVTTRTAAQVRGDLLLETITITGETDWSDMVDRKCLYFGNGDTIFVTSQTVGTTITNLGDDILWVVPFSGTGEVQIDHGETVTFEAVPLGGGDFAVAAIIRESLKVDTLKQATTVGKSLVKLPNPSAVTWARINADNSVTARTAAQTVTDLGLAKEVKSASFTAEVGKTYVLNTPPGTLAITSPVSAATGDTYTIIYPSPSGGTITIDGSSSWLPTLLVRGYLTMYYNGSSWGSLSGGSMLYRFQTLSTIEALSFLRINADDSLTVISPAQARTDLGLGTAATTAASAYATAAQGATADAAIPRPSSPAADDVLQYKSGSWINRTMAQLATDLGTYLASLVGETPMFKSHNRWSATFANIGTGSTELPGRIQIAHAGRTAEKVWIYSATNLGLSANDLCYVNHTSSVADSGYYVVSAGTFTAPNDTSVQPAAGPVNGTINWQSAYGAGATVYYAELAISEISGLLTALNLAADTGYMTKGRFLAGLQMSSSIPTGVEMIRVNAVISGSIWGGLSDHVFYVNSGYTLIQTQTPLTANSAGGGVPALRYLPRLSKTVANNGKMVLFVCASDVDGTTTAIKVDARAVHITSHGTATGTTKLTSFTGP